MTKIEVTGKVIPSGVLDKKFVQGENKMEKIQFALPLNYGGVDMAAMNYTLRLANVAGPWPKPWRTKSTWNGR